MKEGSISTLLSDLIQVLTTEIMLTLMLRSNIKVMRVEGIKAIGTFLVYLMLLDFV